VTPIVVAPRMLTVVFDGFPTNNAVSLNIYTEAKEKVLGTSSQLPETMASPSISSNGMLHFVDILLNVRL
jgi:hypothetical protein